MQQAACQLDFTPVQAIIFDLDDTLYPEVKYVRSGFQAVAGYLAQIAKGANEQQIFDILWKHFQAGDRTRVFNAVLAELGTSLKPASPKIEDLVTFYREHRPNIQLDPATRQLLENLQKRYPLGLLTDGYLPAQKYKVEALAIRDNFDHIIYTEALGRAHWKPSPRGFEKMAEALDCSPQQCVYIGDNPAKDFIAPNQLGWMTIQIALSQGVHRDQPADSAAAADLTLARLSDLTAYLLT